MFLLPKLNTGLAILVGPIDNMNGFELWRSVLKEEDPIHKNEKFHMELDVRQLCSTRCKNFKESMELFMNLEKKSATLKKGIPVAEEGGLELE